MTKSSRRHCVSPPRSSSSEQRPPSIKKERREALMLHRRQRLQRRIPTRMRLLRGRTVFVAAPPQNSSSADCFFHGKMSNIPMATSSCSSGDKISLVRFQPGRRKKSTFGSARAEAPRVEIPLPDAETMAALRPEPDSDADTIPYSDSESESY